MYAIRNWGWFSNFIYDGGLCTFALFECLVYLLFILLLIFVFAALFHSWSVEKKKQKSQEGSLRNSANFCTVPVALSSCKTCCLTYMSSVVFVLYDGICPAVYAPVTLPSLLFLFFPPGMSVLRSACVFTLCLCCCLFDMTFFFCPNFGSKNERLNFKASLSWLKFLSERSHFFPRFWTEWVEHIVLLSYAIFFFDKLGCSRVYRFLLVARSGGMSRVFACTLTVQLCTELVHVLNAGAAIFWLQLACHLFFSLSNFSLKQQICPCGC